MSGELERKTIESEGLWAEYDATPAFDPVQFQEQLNGMGLPVETIDRLRRRGMVITDIPQPGWITVNFIPNSPATSFQLNNMADTTATDEEKKMRWQSFYKDAEHDLDDEHFKAQWPEYHSPEWVGAWYA